MSITRSCTASFLLVIVGGFLGCRSTETCLPVDISDVLVRVDSASCQPGEPLDAEEEDLCPCKVYLTAGSFEVEMDSWSDPPDCIFAADGDGSRVYSVRLEDDNAQVIAEEEVDLREKPDCAPLEVRLE